MGPMGSAIKSKYKRNGPKALQFSTILCIICLKGGLTTKELNIIRSKSNSINFSGSLRMRNQIETQKERSRDTSIQHNSLHYLPRGRGGGSENKRVEHFSIQIKFYHVLRDPWDAQSNRNKKGTFQRHFKSAKFNPLLA